MNDHDAPVDERFTAAFWDDRYGTAERLWSGAPNTQLVAEAADLEPGTALDAGCGEGGDAHWLAARGWRVTALDVSTVALRRGAAHAPPDVADRIRWQQADLRRGPAGAATLRAGVRVSGPATPAGACRGTPACPPARRT